MYYSSLLPWLYFHPWFCHYTCCMDSGGWEKMLHLGLLFIGHSGHLKRSVHTHTLSQTTLLPVFQLCSFSVPDYSAKLLAITHKLVYICTFDHVSLQVKWQTGLLLEVLPTGRIWLHYYPSGSSLSVPECCNCLLSSSVSITYRTMYIRSPFSSIS